MFLLNGKRALCLRPDATPNGFDSVNHRLVENPRELENVKKIIELWNRGESLRKVAQELNRLKILTRRRKKWDHSSVGRIIRQAQFKNGPYFDLGLKVRK